MIPAAAAKIAHELVGELHPRWEHLQALGRQAEAIAATTDFPERVVVAAWLHDIGYSPALQDTGFHPLDGARYLAERGMDAPVVNLVAWHTGAGYEAAARGLSDDLAGFPTPRSDDLDALTMLDLATAPDGRPVRDSDRVAEILSRYRPGDAVHEAVTASRADLLVASQRAKTALGLPQSWPLGARSWVSECSQWGSST